MPNQHTGPLSPLKRFNTKYVKDASGCWLWLGAKSYSKGGYGHFSMGGGKTVDAHKAAYILLVGPVPKGMDVCHKCDVTLCVNPAHLFLGDRKTNMQDAIRKERMSKGVHRPDAKLNDNSVRLLRLERKNTSMAKLAKRYGVSRRAVELVLKGKTWKHVV